MTIAGYWGNLSLAAQIKIGVAALAALVPAIVRARRLTLRQVTETFLLGLVPSRRHHPRRMERLAHGERTPCRPCPRTRTRVFASKSGGYRCGRGEQARERVVKRAEPENAPVRKWQQRCRECILLNEALPVPTRTRGCTIRDGRS